MYIGIFNFHCQPRPSTSTFVPLCLFLAIIVVTAGVLVKSVTGNLEDASRHRPDEINVVGNQEDRALVLLERLLQKATSVKIEMCRRFVEKQEIRRGEEEA